MVAMKKTLTALVASLFLVALIPPADAQIYNCGEVDVIFLNPDLNARAEAGIIEASGSLFGQFQVHGENADKVEYIGFSFGLDPTNVDYTQFCQTDGYNGYYFSGQQILNYRADLDPSDGFFINLQTELVPDGDYSAAVHAFDANHNELGRFWARAVVDNCSDGNPNADPAGRCAANLDVDDTQPWPIVYPGDGQFPDFEGFPSQGLSIEVAEALSEIQVILNGEDITDQLVEFPGRLWDDDLKPGYGPQGVISSNPVTAECNTIFPTTPQLHECGHLGVAYKWEERALEKGDVLNVRVVDLFGNEAKKDVHVGYGISSGISTADYPILEWQADHVIAEVEAGDSHEFPFTIKNTGGKQGHPFSYDELQFVPEGWDYSWSAHVPVDPGESAETAFTIKVPDNATEGRHQVTVGMGYKGESAQDVELQQILTVEVVGSSAADTADLDSMDTEEQESPAIAAPILLAGLGAMMALRRRRE